ncbi:hypothetical protein FRC17_008117 [Serendipita sp. 399]|nr:hypothetical protein FRC17_008117 [Serendipita sp. 399]
MRFSILAIVLAVTSTVVVAVPVKHGEKSNVSSQWSPYDPYNQAEPASELEAIHHNEEAKEEHAREAPHLVRCQTAQQHRTHAAAHTIQQRSHAATAARSKTRAARCRTEADAHPDAAQFFPAEAARSDRVAAKEGHLSESHRYSAIAHTHEALALENPAQAALNQGHAETARARAQHHANQAAAIQV